MESQLAVTWPAGQSLLPLRTTRATEPQYVVQARVAIKGTDTEYMPTNSGGLSWRTNLRRVKSYRDRTV